MGKKHIRISTNSNLPWHHQSLQEGDQRLATFMSWIGLFMWFWASDAHAHNPKSSWLTLRLSPTGCYPVATVAFTTWSWFFEIHILPHGYIQPSPCGMHVQKRLENFGASKNASWQNFELSTQAVWQHMEFFSRSDLTPPSVLLLPHRIQKLAREVLFQYILLVEPDSKSWTRKNLLASFFTGVFWVGFWLETCQVIAPSQIWRNLTQGSEILHWTISTF